MLTGKTPIEISQIHCEIATMGGLWLKLGREYVHCPEGQKFFRSKFQLNPKLMRTTEETMQEAFDI